jgi:hypothetical protein
MVDGVRPGCEQPDDVFWYTAPVRHGRSAHGRDGAGASAADLFVILAEGSQCHSDAAAKASERAKLSCVCKPPNIRPVEGAVALVSASVGPQQR